MSTPLDEIVDTKRHPLTDAHYRQSCRETLDKDGALVLQGFLRPGALEIIRREADENRHHAYFCTQEHNVYLAPSDPNYACNHPRNRTVKSSKGCITDDVVPRNSPLRTLYDSAIFRDFLCVVLNETSLHEYADPLSSINLHYADSGQELGWHFDNSSFAITLMIQDPEDGGGFKYVAGMRDADNGETNYEGVRKVLDGEIEPSELAIVAGTLLLFRGRNAMHCVAPVEGARTRILAVLAYNSRPGVSLSESARMTFYGRVR